MKGRLILALVPGAILLATVPVVALTLTSGSPHISSLSSTDPLSVTWMAFRDDSANVDFAVQLGPGATGTANFRFVVGGVGNYQGESPIATSGSNITHLTGTVIGEFTPIGSDTPQSTSIRLDGIVDTSHNSASIDIWASGAHYHVGSQSAVPADAPGVAQRALNAVLKQDWTTIYGLLASPLQTQLTLSQFIAASTGQTVPLILTAAIDRAGTESTVGGQDTWQQPIKLTVKKMDGTVQGYSAIMTLVSEGGQWRILGTGVPS
jgi:hypothetical protein